MADPDALPEDTPTHRLHMMQMTIQQMAALITRLQHRRATQSEKITKAKANTAIARSLQVDKQFKRLVTQLESKLSDIEDALDSAADKLNKARALFFEASGGEVLMEKEVTDGDAQVERS